MLAALLGCAPAPNAGSNWLTQPSRDQHTAHFFPIALGPHAVDCNSCHGTSDSFKGFDCLTCHLQPATASAHVSVAGFAYSNPSCYSCHPDGNAMAAVNHKSRFPIAAGDVHAIGSPAVHVAGNFDCASCHTTGFSKQVDCTGCHDAADQSLKHDGLVAPEPGGGAPLWSGSGSTPTGETANCLLCHAVGGVHRVATHAKTVAKPAGFAILAGGHFQSCEQCHTGRSAIAPRKNAEIDFAATVRQCTSCHTEPKTSANHLGTSWPGYSGTYSYSDAACVRCHPTGDIGPFDHKPNFPTAAADVHNSSVATCLDCHTSTTAPQDVTTIDCVGCHNNNTSAPLPVDPGGINAKHSKPFAAVTIVGFGYSFDTSTAGARVATNGLCLKCHAGTIATPSWKNPLKFPISQHSSCMSITSGDHRVNQTVSGAVPVCFSCHDTMNATAKPWGVNWAHAQCLACHSNRSATCR